MTQTTPPDAPSAALPEDQPLPGMASTASLPTPEEIIARANLELSTAYRALGDAAD